MRDIWIFEATRGTTSRFTFDPADDLNPVFSPDGTRILFASDRRGARDLFWKASSGVGEDELVVQSQHPKSADDWSPTAASSSTTRAEAAMRGVYGSCRSAAIASRSVPGQPFHVRPGPDLVRRPVDRL
jgi:dipeptidyl aminopeptidase/acylaminoacyl peptidase